MSRVRLDGELICPGAIRAKASCRFFGFSTMPTTRRVRPLTGQLSPIARRNVAATADVIATWPAPLGELPDTRWLLGAQIDRIDRAGHRDVRMLDRFDGAERLFRRGDVSGRLLARIGDVDPGIGRPGEGLFGALHVHDQPKPDDGRCDRYGEQGDYEELLAPLAAKQPPGPPRYGPAPRATPTWGRRRHENGRGWRRQGAGHRAGPASNSDSGPSCSAVWSTIRPSRRNTTRSAQAASCASWVTTTPA